jgi:hypothetical protein
MQTPFTELLKIRQFCLGMKANELHAIPVSRHPTVCA